MLFLKKFAYEEQTIIVSSKNIRTCILEQFEAITFMREEKRERGENRRDRSYICIYMGEDESSVSR